MEHPDAWGRSANESGVIFDQQPQASPQRIIPLVRTKERAGGVIWRQKRPRRSSVDAAGFRRVLLSRNRKRKRRVLAGVTHPP